MQFNLHKFDDGKTYGNLRYICNVEGLNMAGHGWTIEEAIKDFLNCYEYYTNRNFFIGG